MPADKDFPSPIRLHVRADSAADGSMPTDPFIRLLADAHPLRAYLASVEVDGRVFVPHVTILMEPNEYPGSRTAGSPAIGNLSIERIWREGFRRYQRTASRSVAQLERRALPASASDGDLPSHAPLAWCRKTGAYITPLCPACLGVMHTCRDENLLRRSGLPSYENGLVRFLTCPTCSQGKGRAPVFYTFSLRRFERIADGISVRRRSELYRDLGAVIAGSEAAAREDAAERHPCFRCEHRAACYPANRHVDDRVPAEDLLFPLAYYDFHWIPLEPAPLGFHEAVAFLGGADPDGLNDATRESARDVPLRREALAAFGEAGRQVYFEGDATGLSALEALYLKLAAMTDLARGAQDLLEATGDPHLALTPDRLRARLLPGPAIVPVRWGLAVEIADLLTTARPLELDVDRIEGEPGVAGLPYPCPEAYLPAAMGRPQIEHLSMRLALENLDVKETSGKWRAQFTARLTAPDLYRAADHGNRDLVRVVLVVGSAANQRIVFSGRKTASVAGGFRFTGTAGALSADTCAALKSTDLATSTNVEVTLVHVFAAPADVMSLGLVMLRVLLANDGQDLSQVDTRLAGELAVAVATPGGGGVSAEYARLQAALQSAGIASGAREVLYRAIDRDAVDAAIPASLWNDALLLALRMASNVAGWSICGAQDDFDPADPAQPLQTVVQELEELAERARGSLIGSAGRNASVQAVCDDFLADLEEAARSGQTRTMPDNLDQTMVFPPREAKP